MIRGRYYNFLSDKFASQNSGLFEMSIELRTSYEEMLLESIKYRPMSAAVWSMLSLVSF